MYVATVLYVKQQAFYALSTQNFPMIIFFNIFTVSIACIKAV